MCSDVADWRNAIRRCLYSISIQTTFLRGCYRNMFEPLHTHTLRPFIHSFARPERKIPQPTGLCVCSKTLNFFSGSIDLLNVASVRHVVLANFCQSFFRGLQIRKNKIKRKVERQNYFYHSNYWSESEWLSADRKRGDTYSSWKCLDHYLLTFQLWIRLFSFVFICSLLFRSIYK